MATVLARAGEAAVRLASNVRFEGNVVDVKFGGRGQSMTPTEIALANYTLPFKLKPFQVEVVDDLGPLDDRGTTLTWAAERQRAQPWSPSSERSIYDERCVVIMPPILLKQWEEWLKTIKPSVSVVKYAGTPAERKALSLDADFVLVGIQIFKKEYLGSCLTSGPAVRDHRG